ncbi:MAG: hypothetical protein RIC29_17970 [Rhodospirillaceae bacterium]
MLDIMKRAFAGGAESGLSRREALSVPAIGAAATAFGMNSAQAASHVEATYMPPSSGRVLSEQFSFENPLAKMKAEFRLGRAWEDEADVLLWYFFTMFIVAEGKKVQPVVRYEGIEFSHHRKIGENLFEVHGHNTSYPRDVYTGEFIEELVNPVTGKTHGVTPTILTEDPGMIYGVAGKRPLDREGAEFTETYSLFRLEDDIVKQEEIRVPPDNWFTPFIETSHNWTPRGMFEDESITRLPLGTSGGYVFPYPSWLEMEDNPGHMFAIWSGKKLDGVHQLPQSYFDKIQQDNPELLVVDKSKFKG